MKSLAMAAFRSVHAAMLRGYRGAFAAFAGLVLVGTGEPPKQNRSTSAGDGSAEIAKGLSDIQTALKEANKPDEEDKPCSRNQDNRNSDLCAQWKAADAARDAADLAWWQVVGGFILGIVTTAAAISAAYFARIAARETKRSADVAWFIGKAQSEGVVSITFDWISIGVGNICLPLTIKNIGNSPVYGVESKFVVFGYNESECFYRSNRQKLRAAGILFDLANPLRAAAKIDYDAILSALGDKAPVACIRIIVIVVVSCRTAMRDKVQTVFRMDSGYIAPNNHAVDGVNWSGPAVTAFRSAHRKHQD